MEEMEKDSRLALCQVVMCCCYTCYLTIRPVARKGYGSIVHEATKPNRLLTVALEGEGPNCFSITQLVGQKKAIKNSAKKYLFI